MFFNVLCILKNFLSDFNFDNALTIFCGVIGILIAVVIFIAEIISDRNTSKIEKEIILNNINILKLIYNSIGVFIFFLFSFVINDTKYIFLFNDIGLLSLYLLAISAIGYIIYIFCNVYKCFKSIIMYKMNDKYRFEMIKAYLKKEVSIYYNEKDLLKNKLEKNSNEFNKNIDSKQFDDYLCSRTIETPYFFSSPEHGIIENIDCCRLAIVIDSFLSKLKKEYNGKTLYLKVCFYKNIGESIFNGENIFGIDIASDNEDIKKFLLKNLYDLYIAIFGCIKINNSDINYEKLTRKISDIFKLITDDDSAFAFKFVKELYSIYDKSEYSDIIDLFNSSFFNNILFKIENNFDISFEEEAKFKNYIYYCVSLELELEKNKISIIPRIMSACRYLINKSKDSKNVSFYFSTKILNNLFYGIKDKNNRKIYDAFLAELLLVIVSLFKEKKLDELSIIFNNIKIYDKEKNIDSNLLFCLGVVKIISVYYDKDKNFIIENQEKIENIINIMLKNIIKLNKKIYFFNYVRYIVRNEGEYSKIISTIRSIEFNILKDDYSNSWAGFCCDEKEMSMLLFAILKEKAGIEFVLTKEDITIDMNNVLNCFNSSSFDDKYKVIFSIDKDDFDCIKENLVTPCINVCKEKVSETINKNDISNRISLFEEKIQKKLDINEIVSFNVPEYSEDIIDKPIIITDNIDILYFYSLNNNYQRILDNYLCFFEKIIHGMIRDKINENILKSYDSLDLFFSDVDNVEEYYIFTSTYNKKYVDDYTYNGKKIKKVYLNYYDYFDCEFCYIVKGDNIPIVHFGGADIEGIFRHYKYIKVSENFDGDKINILCEFIMRVDIKKEKEYYRARIINII